ncbi:hypothetical protein ASPACDRAFT_45769 [Aspergillus aculeatus ATCC 16872]|uniref:Carboxylesterase type B domain-containing protein n=1 Tax=Aspergillus aculeatus (strain ATCC 16872 / CBS 172.66 / WB 5094) TaxID=690307 RepID=A0A1L9WND7_ASPA1|nr:uncharacterized protein ASPACDRAFT_45769 [Aspergillus aculeatus ATCC 16872]OJJ97673.1 hypothetical protein ASPACDRAFT_45769 [Aspergillus aculeatus ATCC 16872]
MVWIYGGGGSFGQIYDSANDPTGLVTGADQKGFPIIYVAMNYRVVIFGFAASPALAASDSLNLGLLSRHTAVGERKHPSNPPSWNRGSPMGDPGTAGNKSSVHTAQLTKLVNCTGTASIAECNDYARCPCSNSTQRPSRTRRPSAVTRAWMSFISNSPSSFIPDRPCQHLATGQFSRNIDTLGGWNENDGSFSTLPTLASDTQVALFLNILAQYFRASRMKRDTEFSCPALYTAQMTARYATVPTATNCLFAFNQTLFRSWYAATSSSDLGVSHFSDIPYVFNQAQSSPRYAPYATLADGLLSSEMSGSWAAFAAFGSPSHGNGTIAGWTGLTNEQFPVQIIGGPDSGVRESGQNVIRGGYEGLAARCAF